MILLVIIPVTMLILELHYKRMNKILDQSEKNLNKIFEDLKK